jgi:hypothetical protein
MLKELRLTFLWQLNIFHGALYHLDDLRDSVGASKLARVLCHVSRLDGVNLPGPGLRAPDGKDSAPRADVKDHLTDPPNSSSRIPKFDRKLDF